MNLKIVKEDPLDILSSTKHVVERAGSVLINQTKIKDLIPVIKDRVKAGTDYATASAGSLGDYKKDSQLLLIEDCVNFCFWAEKDKEKWQVEYPKGKIITGGWFALEACFKRSLEKGPLILSADYLSKITLKDVRQIFMSSNGIEIPLMAERHKNLRECGRVLLKKYHGQFINLLEDSSFDTIQIVKNIIKHFNSFKDTSTYLGRKINFYKRAQLLVNDVDIAFKKNSKIKIRNKQGLTAFADYKLPQILRMYGVLNYSKDLAQKVDNYILIPKGSREEIEIRSATIWAVELIRQKIPQFSAVDIDNAIWLISQDQTKVEKPYHRAYTIYY